METYTDGDNTFKLKISDIDGNVCEQMKSSMGGIVRDIICDENAKTALMTFNKDLSTTDLPKTESVIDKNITNPEDCQKAGKTWCVEAFSEEGQCSNSTDCCRGVTAPACKQCLTVENMYAIGNSLQNSDCDSDGDGTKDGQCLPDGSEEGNLTCQQVSCTETQTCCVFYDMYYLQQLMEEIANSGDELRMMAFVKHLNEFQCGTCDPESGQITFLPDGTLCDFVEFPTGATGYGNCVNGSCATFNPDAFLKSCTSYTNCDSGEYCQFFEKTVPTDPKPEKGIVCLYQIGKRALHSKNLLCMKLYLLRRPLIGGHRRIYARQWEKGLRRGQNLVVRVMVMNIMNIIVM